MSQYLEMWQAVNQLTGTQAREWLKALSPARGVEINFRGVYVNDTDLLEALAHVEEQNGRTRQPTMYKELDGSVVINWGLRDGELPPHPVLIAPQFLVELVNSFNENIKH